jgi:hypothetical protein
MLISPAPRHEVALSVRPLYCNRSKIVIAYPRPFISQLDRPIKSPIDRGCDRWGWGKGLHKMRTPSISKAGIPVIQVYQGCGNQ